MGVGSDMRIIVCGDFRRSVLFDMKSMVEMEGGGRFKLLDE